MRDRIVVILLTALLAVAGAPAAAHAYSTPKSGSWKVQDVFEVTDGGSATVYRKGTWMKGLNVTIGEGGTAQCDGLTGKVKVIRTLKITRVGSYKRPAVGRLSKKTKLIEPISTRVKVDGAKSQKAKVLVLFDDDGRIATSSRIELSDTCSLTFVLRKR